MGKKRDKLLGNYEKWRESLPGGAWSSAEDLLASFGADEREFFETQANVYNAKTPQGGEVTFDFNPFLADPACYGRPKDIDRIDAFLYLVVYRNACKKAGVTPSDPIDFRYFVTPDGVVDARDC